MSVLDIEKVPLMDGKPGKESVVEVPVLLEGWLLMALEAAAREHGLTTGTMVRRLIRDYLYYSDGGPP